ncbi:unnamed protein product [Paramecium sonneborni]|uniref:Uncharacterized protein n=1 Tax=Paramecium sonneborni TaxID=65129 RepID=A0A8S1R7C9_9CILI|nr:unnamed protein product [Paramecium sonneborni]
MSNIKFIYQKKIHKVPSNVTNYYNLVETIKNSYKTLTNIYLFAIINPENPDLVTEINSDVTFQKLKVAYHKQGWTSIKLLVTENENYQDVLKQSWNLLNQSVVSTEKKNQDASTLVQPNIQDQQQQFVPQFENMSTQAKVQKFDNAQNTNQIDFRNNEQLKQLINEIIDQKLKELGLLKNPINNILPSDYKFQLMMKKIPKFTAIPNKKISINLEFKNIGNLTWKNPYIYNQGLNLNLKFKDLAPEQQGSVMISIPYIDQHFKNNEQYCYRFQIYAEDESGKLHLIDGVIPITVKAPPKIQLSPQEETILKLLELFPQKGEAAIKNFVEKHGKQKTAEELIEQFLL